MRQTMNMTFQTHMEEQPDPMSRLRKCKPFMEKGIVKQEGRKGIYSLEEDGKIVYVGRTRNLRKRLRSHVSFNKRASKASFAFKLTRIKLGKKSYL